MCRAEHNLMCEADFLFYTFSTGLATNLRTQVSQPLLIKLGRMADDGGSNDRGPGLDSTLTAADIETNWDQVHYIRPINPSAQQMQHEL